LKALLIYLSHVWFIVFSIIALSNVFAMGSQPFYYSRNEMFVLLKTNGEQFEAFFSSIQQAINEAENYSTIYVPRGIFYENVIVNKSISLVGANDFSSVIDGRNVGTVLEITASNVVIRGFKLQNSGYGWIKHGIYVYRADYCIIENNYFFNNCHNIRLNYSRYSVVRENIINGVMTQPTMYGIRIENSINCTVEGNHVSDCVGAIHLQNATNCAVSKNLVCRNSQGIRFYTPCTHNLVFDNDFSNNSYEGMISVMPDNATLVGNKVFHNNFINNSSPLIGTIIGIIWDDGYPSGGNYWSRYNGTDFKTGHFQNETGYDGIGDLYYSINPTYKDNYPLMHPYRSIVNKATERVFLTIKSAIVSDETLDGNVITVKRGIYHERITINKSLSLLGEGSSHAIIDGDGFETVVTVKADNVSFAGFTVRNSGSFHPPYGNDCGLLLDHVVDCNISFNVFTNNRIGVYLYFSQNNYLKDNLVFYNLESGIWLWHSGNNILKGNIILNNTYNFGVFGKDFKDFDNNIDTSNTIEGKPIRYVVSSVNSIFDESVSTSVLYLVNCVNVTVQNMKFTGNGQGVLCFNVTGSRFYNLTVSRNNYGMDILSSNNNTVINNYFESNWVGIRLENSIGNTVKNNILISGEKGISLYEANINHIEGNTLKNNVFGIRLFASNLNHIYWNNFIQNNAQVDIISSYQTYWDDNIEGNFWSNYQGIDDNKNGIIDSEYLIDATNIDHKPLSGLYYNFEFNRGGETYEVALVSNSTVHDMIYEDNNHTLVLTVEFSEGTTGFCRVRVPHALVKPKLSVILDDGLFEVLHANYSLLDNDVYSWIYFEYANTVHEIVIVDEFQWQNLYLLLTILAITLILVLKRSITRQQPYSNILIG